MIGINTGLSSWAVSQKRGRFLFCREWLGSADAPRISRMAGLPLTQRRFHEY